MHDLSHVDRMLRAAETLLDECPEPCDIHIIQSAAHLHGIICDNENPIREWFRRNGFSQEKTEKIIQVARESLKEAIPETVEGKILHDAHLIEGGKAFLIVKSLISGSLRGQTLEETIDYLEKNVLGKYRCYLPEAQTVYAESQEFARDFIKELKEGLK